MNKDQEKLVEAINKHLENKDEKELMMILRFIYGLEELP